MHVCVCVSVATRLSHLDYLGHLGHLLSESKWVSPRHACMPDLDQNYLFIMCIQNCNEKDCYSLIEQSPVFQGCNLESS